MQEIQLYSREPVYQLNLIRREYIKKPFPKMQSKVQSRRSKVKNHCHSRSLTLDVRPLTAFSIDSGCAERILSNYSNGIPCILNGIIPV